MGSSAARVERGALRGDSPVRELEVAGGAPRVLALHGFGGTPLEVEAVLDSAKNLGLGGLAPLLPGHGTHARSLATTRFPDWSDAAESALNRVGGPVVLAGFSLGSLLALDLAQRRPDDVKGLILLANAVWLTAPFPRWALTMVERLRIPDFMMKRRPKRYSLTHVSYDAHPVHAAIDVQRNAERIRKGLERVRCPTLILHGALDTTCPVSNAWRVAQRLGSEDCRVLIFPRSRHVLTCDVEQVEVRREIDAFLARFKGDAR